MEKRIGYVGIIIEERRENSLAVNKVLSEYGDLITARVGIPRQGAAQNAVITLVVEATPDEIGAMTGRLGSLPGVSVKSALSKR